jgi:type I restriction enzyme R subunit
LVRERGLEDYIVGELVRRGWRYVDSSSLEREGLDKPLLHSVLRRKIREFNPGVSEEDVSEALSLLEGRSYGPKGAREVLEYLKFGVPVKLSETRTSARLKLIDYENPGRNEFIVSRQVTHVGIREIRNDIVLYVNGIPLVNIEVKSPTEPGVSWRDAFLQIKRYEQDVPELYKYVQIGVAVEAVARYFPIVPWARADAVPLYEWREEGLDSIDSVIEMLRPERLLDILRFYTYFRMEEGRETKVIARYMQYRAANKIVERVLKRLRRETNIDRGLIWHWQGSGKTLTMIFAAMKLYWLLENPMIFFVVDRVELQNQLYYENLTKLDLGPEVKPKLIDSIARLRQVLSYNDYRGEPGVFVVTVQKFLPKEFEELEKLLEAIAKSRPGTVMDREDIIVLVDEAHRTQYGVLAEQMMKLLRKANYFAFTGTPVPRKNPLKNTFAKFSPPSELYLDKYFILDSIRDGYTVRIAYQPGPFDYRLKRELLDEFLESEFDELPEEVRRRVERRIGRELDVRKFKVFLEDPKRIDKVAEYIAKHFRENVDGRFKAMVVATSRRACVLYKRALDKYLPPEYSEVVMTFQSQEKDVLIEEYKRELMNRYHVSDPKEAVQKIIERFRTEENPRILIVTDMLLTGFDAPILQTMYLDKPLKGHRLLQAIARVNRPYRGVKEYGLVIDFIGIFDELERAFAMYEREDLKGAVFDVEDILRRFRTILQQLLQLIGPRPSVKSEEELFKHVRIKAENLAKDKDLERKFTENYRVLRKLYELIAPKLTRQEREEYRWLSDIYTFYMKNLVGASLEEELAEKYYKKTIEAIGRSLQVLEREAEFSPITINREFFEEFIRSRDISHEEKASALIMGIFRFRLYARNDPVYVSVADKIEALLEKWRRKLKTSLELYEEAKRLWEEIYTLKEEQAKLRFGRREYLVYRTLVDAGFKQRHAMEVTKKLMERIKDKISVPGWNHNPKLVHDVERIIALTILREARRAGLSIRDVKELIDLLVERVKRIDTEQRE